MNDATQTVTLEVIDGPTLMYDAERWQHYAYTVRLHCAGRTMDTPWKQGTGITDEPTARAVLEAMLSDATSAEDAETFEDWADGYGFDTDSRRAEAIYNAVRAQTDNLRALLDGSPWRDADDPEDLARQLAGE